MRKVEKMGAKVSKLQVQVNTYNYVGAIWKRDYEEYNHERQWQSISDKHKTFVVNLLLTVHIPTAGARVLDFGSWSAQAAGAE